MVSIDLADPTTPEARVLLKASHDLMASLFPSEANHYLSVEKLAEPHICFFEARDGSAPLGCAAVANMGDYGEIKSMFVAENARGRGLGDMLMQRIVDEARSQQLATLKLETGIGLDAAHRLYQRYGFADCGAFGEYEADAPYSKYMERAI